MPTFRVALSVCAAMVVVGAPSSARDLVPASVASLDPAVRECAMRASSPDDPLPGIPGVRFEQIDADAAIAACEKAVQAVPSAQTHFLLCRSLYRAQRFSESVAHCGRAWQMSNGQTSDTPAILHLVGLHLLHGQGTEREPEVALIAFEMSEAIPDSLLQLGFMHFDGIGTRRDHAKAAAYWERAAAAGVAQAAYQLGFVYRDGLGVVRDPQKAEQFWRRAADAGECDALLELGLLAHQRRNYGDAHHWWTTAAALGEPIAKRNLAVLMMEGPRQQRNETEAFRLFLEAAQGGDRASMRQVAIGYATGMLVDRDLAAAERWTQRLIETNDPDFLPWARQYQADVRALRPMGFLLPRRTPWDEADRAIARARGEANQARIDAEQQILQERLQRSFR